MTTDHKTLSYLIIPAAGLGTRMKSINKNVPKELLPINGSTVIDYAVAEAIHADIKNIILIINPEKAVLRSHIESKFKNLPSVNFTFLYQKELLGEADAISYSRDIVNDYPVAVMYPDNIYFPAPGALKALKSVYEEHEEGVIALNEVTEALAPSLSSAGRVDVRHTSGNLYTIVGFHQKTSGHFVPRHNGELRACGIYAAGPGFCDYIEKARKTVKEGEFTDIYVRNYILKEKGLMGLRLPGTVFDTGNPAGYQLCINHVRQVSQQGR